MNATNENAAHDLAESRRNQVLSQIDPRLLPPKKKYMYWPQRFTGKIAIVTGAASGIGFVTAARLLREGASVVVVDVNDQALAVATEYFSSLGPTRSCAIDLRNQESYASIKESVEDLEGNLSVLVNCAGITHQVPWGSLDEASWDRMMDVNLKATFFVSRMVAELMQASGSHGHIVNLASGAAKLPRPNGAHYAASKAGVVSLTKSLAAGLAESGITVNAICPGGVLTEMAVGPDGWGLPGGRIAAAQTGQLGRPMVPDEVASLILFLSSDEADYITGQAINIDAGQNMSS